MSVTIEAGRRLNLRDTEGSGKPGLGVDRSLYLAG